MYEKSSLKRPRSEPAAALVRLTLAGAIVIVGSSCVPGTLLGQTPGNGTVAILAQDGLRYVEQRRFSDAINVLEEAWERDPSNPIVAEHLALAYLYEQIPPKAEAVSKARELMTFSLAHGGQVSIFVQHLHRGLSWVVSPDDYCSGRLVLTTSGITFRTSLTNHSFTLSSDALAGISVPANKRAASAGGLTLRSKEGKSQRIRTGTLSGSEARIVVQLTRQFLLGG